MEDFEARFAYDRKGFYLGGGAFWAPQAFNTVSGLDVADSRGLSGWIGYRFAPHFAADLRVDRVDDFDFEAPDLRGELDGWSITANAKVFLLTGALQPYFGIGVGAFVSEIDHTHPVTDPGTRFSERDTNGVFRGSAGFDLYLSPSLALNLDAAFVSVTGDLDVVSFGQLGGGLTFHF